MAKRRPYGEQNSQEQERDDHPGEEVDSDGIKFHSGIRAVGITNTRVGDEQGRKREPECAVGRKRYERKKKKSARRPTKRCVRKRATASRVNIYGTPRHCENALAGTHLGSDTVMPRRPSPTCGAVWKNRTTLTHQWRRRYFPKRTPTCQRGIGQGHRRRGPCLPRRWGRRCGVRGHCRGRELGSWRRRRTSLCNN
jgi:hypothetical protein